MIDLDSLRQDHETLSQLLEQRGTVSMETLPLGVQMLWSVYITILRDAVSTLHALVTHLERRR